MTASTSDKGQIFTSDFVASFALFTLFLVIFGVLWNISVDVFGQETDNLERKHDYSFSLLKTPGHPNNWNASNVKILGIYRNGNLDAEKFLELKNFSNFKKRKLVGVQNFHLRAEYLNDTLSKYQGEKLQTYTDVGETKPIPGEQYINNSESEIVTITPRNQTVYASSQETIIDQTGERVELRYYTWQD